MASSTAKICSLIQLSFSSKMLFIRSILFFVALFLASLPVHAMVGGWSSADPKSPEVLKAANFAIDTKFHGEHPHFKITQAKKQV